MIYQIDDIIRDVRIAIDQNASSASLISEGDSDTLTLDEIIKSKLPIPSRRWRWMLLHTCLTVD